MSIKMWHERAREAAPELDPESWPLSFKVGFMEDELIELREKVRALEQAQGSQPLPQGLALEAEQLKR